MVGNNHEKRELSSDLQELVWAQTVQKHLIEAMKANQSTIDAILDRIVSKNMRRRSDDSE